MKGHISIEKAAQIIGVTGLTLRRWVRMGNSPAHFRTPGGVIWFRESDITEWIAAQRVSGGPPANPISNELTKGMGNAA